MHHFALFLLGTLPTALVVGLGEAAKLAMECMESDRRHVEELAGFLLSELRRRLQHIVVNGSLTSRYIGNLNISFEFVEGESLLMSVGDIAMSSGKELFIYSLLILYM